MPDVKIKRSPAVDSNQRAWSQVYDDINDIVKAVNNKSVTESRTKGATGSDGDIRLFKDQDAGKYFIEGKFTDGWAKRQMLFTDKDETIQDEVINYSAVAGFILPDGSVPFTATQAGVTPSNNADLATKGYADGLVPTTMGSSNSYAAGLVLAGSNTHANSFLRKDGSWQVPVDTNTTSYGLTASTGTGFNSLVFSNQPTAGKLRSIKQGTGIVVTVTDTETGGHLEIASDGAAATIATSEVNPLGGYLTYTTANLRFIDGGGITWGFSNASNITEVTPSFSLPSHNHAASSITSGTIADARLPSECGANVTYLTSVPNHSAALLTSGTVADARLPSDCGANATYNNYSHPNHSGEVTSSGDGALTITDSAVITARINNDAVTYAKMQNVSAGRRFLGRNTNSAGDTEEITMGQAVSLLATESGSADEYLCGNGVFREVATSVSMLGISDTAFVSLSDGDLLYYQNSTSLWKNTASISITSQTSGTLPVNRGGTGATSGYNNSNWDTAYTDRLKWDGGATGLTASTARGSIGLDTDDDVRFDSFGVGTAASGTTGEIRATNEVTAYYSDDRLKNRYGNIEKALEKVCSLNGFHYQPNEVAGQLGYDTGQKKVGVSAQEVLKVLPEAVTEAPIDPQYHAVQYDKLVPLLIEAVKELSKRKCGCGSK